MTFYALRKKMEEYKGIKKNQVLKKGTQPGTPTPIKQNETQRIITKNLVTSAQSKT